MSLWDPEAAGNAAIFLRLGDMAMLEIRNTPFEGTKAVWVPVAECGYMKAEVQGKGDKPNTTKVRYLWVCGKSPSFNSTGRLTTPLFILKFQNFVVLRPCSS